MRKHILIGIVAATLLIAVYMGIIIWAESAEHALDRTAELWYWITALAVGFGIQAGLFSYIRQGMRERRMTAGASLGTSGGVTAGSMVACCAHHLSDVLPFLGLSGLAAVLADYQVVFMAGGVLSNIVGITIMLDTIQRHGLSQRMAGWSLNMTRLKRVAMFSAGPIFAGTVLLQFFNPVG